MSNTSEATTKAKEPQAENEALESGATKADAYADSFEPKPDLSDQGAEELLPKLLELFHNNRVELALALGLSRSTVDRWLNGKSRPNNSTLLRMRGLAQERGVV
ncbi:MAG TPA: helix-turn-helix transcriptional regulator [Blastocatellia bacterium]|nr:helix-turn-helix transcriptional regulator [Blastocatellia bacterium]